MIKIKSLFLTAIILFVSSLSLSFEIENAKIGSVLITDFNTPFENGTEGHAGVVVNEYVSNTQPEFIVASHLDGVRHDSFSDHLASYNHLGHFRSTVDNYTEPQRIAIKELAASLIGKSYTVWELYDYVDGVTAPNNPHPLGALYKPESFRCDGLTEWITEVTVYDGTPNQVDGFYIANIPGSDRPLNIANNSPIDKIGPPGQPALSAINNSVLVSWEKPGGAWSNSLYSVYRMKEGGNFELINCSTGISYSDNNIEPATLYTYKIKAGERTATCQSTPDTLWSIFSQANEITTPNTTPSKPTVTTTSATNISNTSVTLNGTVTSDGGATVDERRFDWGVSGSWTNYTSNVQVSGSNFSYNLTGLSPNTTYNYRTWARNSVGWSMGNTVYFTTQSVAAYPDLIVLSPGVSDSTLTPGQSFTVSAIVKNQGNGPSPETVLNYYRSTDSTISTSDTHFSTDLVPSLSSGGTSSESNIVTAPVTAGTYWIGACVSSVIGELNTSNNCSSGVQVTVSTPVLGSIRVSIIPQEAVTAGAQWKLTTENNWLNSGISRSNLPLGTYTIEFKTISGWVTPPNKSVSISVANPDIWVNSDPYIQQTAPDLVVINPSVNDSTLTNGDVFLFSTTVKNQGTSTSSATTLRYYFSTDLTISAVDKQVATDAVGSLSSGAISPEDEVFVIGESIPAGTYWMGACVDSVTGESNTSNNCSSGVQIIVSDSNTPPNTPSNPSPLNGATAVSTATNLDFSGGDSDSGDTVIYDVYLEANDPTPDNIVCNDITSTHCDPSEVLAYNTTYYWKVIAQDNHGATTTSPTWSFKTTANYSLSILKSGDGTIISNPVGINCGNDCSQSYNQGTSVTLSASPSNGWKFDGWSGACSGTGQCIVNMTSNKNVYATFVQIQPHPANFLTNILHLLLLKKGNHFSGEIIITDDFDDNYLDPSIWQDAGVGVVEEGQILKIERSVTDQGGGINTQLFSIDPKKKLVIERKVKIHYANNYFDGSLHLHLDQASNFTFGINYSNYAYSSGNEVPKYGFYLIRNAANAHLLSDQSNVSDLINPVWDQYFNEKIIYDPTTGMLEYYINNNKKKEYFVGLLPTLSKYQMRLAFNCWGWWAGHYQYMDDFKVYQQ